MTPTTRLLTATAFALLLLTGCKSKQDQAIDQAKQQAASTGQAQQVVWTDKNGVTTTTVVQPPVPGQTTQAISTTTTKSPAGTPAADGSAPQQGPAPAAGYGAPVAANQPAPPDVHIPAGTSIVIRINQHINVKHSHVGERFTGEVAEDVATQPGAPIIVPRGTHVSGVVDASHRRGHFKGSSILELRLTSMTLNGLEYPLDTHDIVRTKKGKGKRSGAFIGGGAGLGMLVGGVATGGVGLVVGGLAGGGLGTAVAGMTGNRDIDIPAESLMRFRLADDLVVQPNQ
jgi:hypothetical protein